jgi:hypothetical protein
MTITEAVMTVLVVGICVGLPVLGLTLRFAFKPMLEAWVSLKGARSGRDEELDTLRVRVAALEAVWEHRLGAGTLDAPTPALTAVNRSRV